MSPKPSASAGRPCSSATRRPRPRAAAMPWWSRSRDRSPIGTSAKAAPVRFRPQCRFGALRARAELLRRLLDKPVIADRRRRNCALRSFFARGVVARRRCRPGFRCQIRPPHAAGGAILGGRSRCGNAFAKRLFGARAHSVQRHQRALPGAGLRHRRWQDRGRGYDALHRAHAGLQALCGRHRPVQSAALRSCHHPDRSGHGWQGGVLFRR